MTAALLAAFYAVMAGSLAYAWLKGGGAERIGVLLLIVFFVFRLALRPLIPAQFDDVDPLALAQDLLGFVAFMWIGLRARRYWPLLAAALQLLSLSAHFARALHLPVDPWAYALLKSLPTLMVYVVLAIGTANYQRRVRARKRSALFPGFAGPAMEPFWLRPSFHLPPRGSKPFSSPSTTKQGPTSGHSSAKAGRAASRSNTEI